MKIYERIIIFFLLCVLFITLLITLNQSYEVTNIENLAKEELTKKQEMMNDLLIMENRTIKALINDYSHRKEMLYFIREKDQDWAKQNLSYSFQSVNIPCIWVFDAKSILIYSQFLIEPKQELSRLLTKEILSNAFRSEGYCHFFLPSSNGIAEIEGSILYSQEKVHDTSTIAGYLLVGRIWDDNLIHQISNLGSYFKVEMDLSTTPFTYNYDQTTSMLQISKPLFDDQGKVISYLGIRIPSEILKHFYKILNRYYFIGSLSVGFFLLLILLVFFSWIFPPLQLLSETLKTENLKSLEKLKKDESEFGEIANLMVSFFKQKKVLMVEIEEKKSALENLRQSEEHFRVLSESLPCYVLIIQDNKIQYVNSLFINRFSYSDYELNLQDINLIIHPDYMEVLKQKINATLQETFHFTHIDVPLISKAGELVWLDLSLGKTIFRSRSAVIVSGFDITERKKIQRELEKTLMIKSNFTSMVSHELRTPLAAIKGAIDLTMNTNCGELNKNQQASLQIAKRNVDRLHRLIDEILDFQKLESGNIVLHFETISLKEVIEESVKTMKPLVTEKGLAFHTLIPKNMPPILADKDRIYQVMINLINNAIKFTIQGEISVKCKVLPDFIQVTVQDTGVGIRSEDTEKLFQQYSQIADNSLQKYPGTGLGLAICKEIINHHKGTISVESQLGIGTSFIFTLPLSKS